MQGPSRAAFTASRTALGDVLAADPDRWALGEDLFAVVGVTHANITLRRAMADPSREGADKAALVTRVFGDKVGTEARTVTEQAVAQRWSEEHDLVDALESLAVESLLAQAEAESRLGRVEDELFRFGRVVEGHHDLRTALTDRRADRRAKAELVDRLLHGKAEPETLRLARQAVLSPRGRRLDRALEGYLRIAARRQEQLTAIVTAAVELSQAQRERLTRALAEMYGRAVQTNVIVDPDVVGGIRVEIGDEVIDGTIASRLEDARRSFTG